MVDTLSLPTHTSIHTNLFHGGGKVLSIPTTKIVIKIPLHVISMQLKAIVVSDRLEVLQEAAVQFDNDLPEYR